MKLSGTFLPEFWISYSSGLFSRLIKRETVFPDKRTNLNIRHFIKELSDIYDPFQITSENGLTFHTEDLPKTIEEIEKTRDLLIEIEKTI